MPLPSLAAIAVREGTFQQGGWKTPPPPAMLDQKKPGRIRVKEMFARLSDACKRELRNTKTDFTVPRRKSAFGQKCFSFKGAQSWDDLSV